MTPRDLLAAGDCSAACIAAVTTSRTCRCSCAGRHHGLVADCEITAVLDARTDRLHLKTDQEVIADAR